MQKYKKPRMIFKLLEEQTNKLYILLVSIFLLLVTHFSLFQNRIHLKQILGNSDLAVFYPLAFLWLILLA